MAPCSPRPLHVGDLSLHCCAGIRGSVLSPHLTAPSQDIVGAQDNDWLALVLLATLALAQLDDGDTGGE
jgi:hypothetical protein